METNQFKISDYLEQLNSKTKKHNKFNEDIIILNESFDKKVDENNYININQIKPIFILTVELERGKLEKIKIFPDSDPKAIVSSFCNEHDLDDSAFQYLKEKIEYLLEDYKNNKQINIKKYINDINNDLKNKNNKFEIEENKDISNNKDINNNSSSSDINTKNEYFECYKIDNENKNKSYKLAQNYDINNITIKKNKSNNNYFIIKNNTEKKYNDNINTSNTKPNLSNKKCQSYKNNNKKDNQINKNINYFFSKNNKVNKNDKNDKNNMKINNYYNYYNSKSLNSIKISKQKKYYSKANTNTSTNRKIMKDNDYFIKKVFEENEKKRITRKRSSYFRSILSKNESIGKNITNHDTYSSSKINTETYNTNHTSSRIILEGIKFNKENPVIINNKKINNYGQYLYERNRITKKEKQRQIYQIQREGEIDQYKLCSFMPKTNSCQFTNIHSKYKMKKNIIEPKDIQFNFRPKINNNYKTALNFEQRQKIYINLYKQRNEELKNCLINSKYDQNGNELFKPKLISKQYNSNKSIDIFDKNYAYYKKYNLDKKNLYNKFYKNDTREEKNCPKEKTDKLLNDLYVRVFTKLFKDLDNDQDNLITSFTINLSNIPKNILKIIQPIIKELRDDNQTLNCEEFILVMIRLFEDTSLVDRQTLINYYQNKIKNDNNNNNKNLLMNRSHTPIYSRINLFYSNDNYSNNSNYTRNNSSKSIILYNKNEKMALRHEQKMYKNYFNIMNNKETNDNNFDDYNSLQKRKFRNININNDINDELNGISKLTFNNYLKQVKN